MEKIPEVSPEPENPTNFHEVSEERREFREVISGLKNKIKEGKLKKSSGEILVADEIDSLEEKNKQADAFKVADYGGLSGAKTFLNKQKSEYEQKILDELSGIDYDSILQESPEIKEPKDLLANIASLKDYRVQIMLEILSSDTSQAKKKRHEGRLKKINEEIEKSEKELSKVDMVVLRQAEIVEYKENLAQSGHICITPSVERDLEAIGDRMLTGKPMFLHGPTGTGKTSLARYAARHFTGKDPEMVFCNPQTKESNVWGKTGIKPTKSGAIETVEIYGPLAKAMAEGKTVIFDEFTALPKEQMVFIKGVFNARVGDKINIVGNGIVEIAPGFQMIFTANLKSEKNPERQDLPPEIAREFEQNNLEVKYTPPDEAYDIILARLLNRDGSLDMSFHDLNTTLPNLCRVMSEIQESYTNETDKEVARRSGAMDASGKMYSLKKFVMTQGSVEAILSSWLIEKQTGKKERSFAEFLDERFKTALTFKEYPKEDRILVAKILASKGFLLTLDAKKDLDLPEDIFQFNTIKRLRGAEAVEELQAKSGDTKHLSLKEVAMLDPFGRRANLLRDQAEALLGNEQVGGVDDFSRSLRGELGVVEDPTIEFTPFLKETYGKWGVEADKINNVTIKTEIINPDTIDYPTRQADVDISKFGEFTINPDTQNLDWEALRDKIYIPDLSALEGEPLAEVAKHLIDTYSDRYKLPGIEYWKFILENPDKVPTQFKDGNYYYQFGSLLRGSYGSWDVPYAGWGGSAWDRSARWLGNAWDAHGRVVLLEKI